MVYYRPGDRLNWSGLDVISMTYPKGQDFESNWLASWFPRRPWIERRWPDREPPEYYPSLEELKKRYPEITEWKPETKLMQTWLDEVLYERENNHTMRQRAAIADGFVRFVGWLIPLRTLVFISFLMQWLYSRGTIGNSVEQGFNTFSLNIFLSNDWHNLLFLGFMLSWLIVGIWLLKFVRNAIRGVYRWAKDRAEP